MAALPVHHRASVSRTRQRRASLLGLLLAGWLAGCGGPSAEPELVWGRRGVQNGDLVKPRAVAIDARDRLYVVDFTARIQVYDRDGNYLGPTWTTPDYRAGRPSGLSIDRDGNLLVADSHYNCLRTYSPAGELLRSFDNPAPGRSGYVSDAVQDDDGFYYLAESGWQERIVKCDASGKLVSAWGSDGTEPGQFSRVRALCLGPEGLLYAADSCNHRIQVFRRDGQLVRCFGEMGTEPGQLRFPYDLAFNHRGELYVVEWGNHRVQKFTAEGVSLGCWGGPGHEPGRLHSPWALGVDSRGRVHVIDSENHRVQRIDF
jgi:hypothetical protein